MSWAITNRAEIAELSRTLMPKQIADRYKITPRTVRNIMREFGVPANPVGGVRVYGAKLQARGRNSRIGWQLRPRGQRELEWAA